MTEADDESAQLGRADTLANAQPTDERTDLDDELLRAQVKARMFGTGAPVKIGRYELTGRLGQGGMGVVYAAVDRELERKVAIKLLLPGRPAGVDRMMREARALARLAHPNVVTVHEVGTHEGQVYVAMEFVEGPTLRQWLREPRSLGETLGVFAQAARGLHAAHAAGLVHRDFKPDNVIVGLDGRVRVLDFGLAKRTELEEIDDAPPSDDAGRIAVTHALTQTGQLVGTPAYMAPEQILGRSVDGRADVFALCVALFEALEHRRPFAGDDVVALHGEMLGKTPRPALPPPKLGAAIQAGLSYDPESRSLDRLIGALDQALVPDDARGKILKATAAAIVGAAALSGLAGLFVYSEKPAPPAPPIPEMPQVPQVPVPARIEYAISNDATNTWLDSPTCEPYEPERGRAHAPGEAVVATRARAALDDDDRDLACGVLREHFAGAGPIDDDARCLYAQFCRGIASPTCPERMTPIGSAGCIEKDTCHAEPEAMTFACERGEIACCDRVADADLAKAVRAEQKGDPGAAKPLRAHARDVYELVCVAGIDSACMHSAGLARAVDDTAAAVRLHAIACGRGHVQACRRVARVGETSPDPKDLPLAMRCATEVSPTCPVAHRGAALLVRMAECGAIAHEVPAASWTGKPVDAVGGFDPGDATGAEATAMRRAASRYRSELGADARVIALAAGIRPGIIEHADDAALHEKIVQALELDRRQPRVIAIQRTIADERAGFVEAPADPAALDPLERWVRLEADLGERLHRAIAAELGDARTEELHRIYGHWPASVTSGIVVHGACPGD